jgi:2-dehydropantoate 2-reductase
MKVAIVGAGAIGGLIGFRLARAGEDVSLLARGTTLQALQRHGLRMQGDTLQSCAVRAAQDPAEFGAQDLVVIALKAQALPEVAPGLPALMGPDTVVLSAMNGVPWWFFDRFGGPCEGMALQSVDPGGVIARALPPRSVIGGVVHLAAASPEPGIVQHKMGERLILGEPAGGTSPRVESLAQLLRRAGFQVEVSPQIQRDVWFKLWGNMTMNPLSAVAGATTDRLLDDELVRGFASRCMEEARAVGERIGIAIEGSPEERHAVTRKLGAMRTSMLQDVDAGKPVELDALVGAVREIAARAGVATPSIDALFGLARLHARVRGLYPG